MGTLVPFMMFFSFVMFHHVTSAQNDCGNTSFSKSKGVITSPNFPLSNPQNLSCTYSIDVGRNNSVLLKFLEFDLESPLYADTSCIHDFLTITCNETDDENLDFRKRSCGMDPPKTSLWFSNCPVVQLTFFADSSVSGGGFSIEYNVIETANLADNISEIDCGDSMFTSSSGLIRLPSNPTEYSAKVDCNYTISANNASIFSLGVLSLQLPQLLDSLADCDIDYITIGCVSIEATELNPNTSRTYCRRSFDNIPVQPSRIVFSNCSMVTISIRSSDYTYQGDDSIPFTVSAYDEDCGITVFSGSTGLINSPRFPLSYPHSLDCIYFFDVDRTIAVTLDFLLFNLEGYSRAPVEDYCPYTWLKISCLSDCGSASANPNQNRKYCGQRVKPLELSYSNCDCLTLNFVTNSSATTQGFQFRYEMTSPGNETASTPDKDRRNISVTDPTGFITSPHYPLSYPHKIDYIYSFNVNRTQTVGLYFYSFNVEGTSHSLYIDTCHYDWLEIACKPGVWRYSRNSRYCGEKTTPLILSYSNCDSLTLNFVSDSSITSGGFKIWYSVSSAGQTDCRETSFTDRNGVLVSPNFPLSYPINMNCTYAIDVGRNNSVQLKFKYFELQAPRSTGYCANDWLTITCNETTKVNPNYGKKYCGSIQWSSSLRFVDCPSLVMEFVSDSSLHSHGFMLEYTVTEKSNTSDDNSELDCGDTLFTESSGNISLPGNPTGYLATVNCTYTISTNRTDVIWLNAYFQTTMKFLQSFQDCEGESVMIGCVAGEEAEFNRSSAKVFCRGGIFSPSSSGNLLVFSDCRTLKLSIRSTNYDNQETFSIPFSVLGQDEVCGNVSSLSSPTGVVSTLRVPYRYPKRVNCQYTIDSGQINSVIISVDRLNFQYAYYMDSSCNFGWLTITCLVNGTSMANRKLCGIRYSIKARFPECQEVLLNLTSDYISSDSGLTLRYRVGDYELDCGTTLFTNSSGVISLPINPTGYPATVNCTYTVSANDSSYIFLNSYLSSSTQFLNSFQDCSTEWLKVGCVSDEDAELNPLTTKTYCQQQNPSYGYYRYPMLYADCRTVKLSIRSRTYDLREGFRIAFLAVGPDNICGKTSFSDRTGTVSSPHLPFRYSKRVSCVYTIDSGEVNSFTLSIDRLSFGDEYGRQRGCDSGWLTITCLMNGTAIVHPLAGRKLCGLPHGYDKMTGRFHACRSVLLNFTSGSVSSSSSFNVRYRIGDYELDCGTTLFNFAGFLSLPNSPTNFPATVNCTYTISTNRTSDISLNIHYYSLREFLKSFQDCDRDNVTIACIPEEETDLNRVRTRVLCFRDISSIPYSDTRLVFTDCFTLKLVIRSATYDYRHMQRVPFSVIAADEICGNTSFSAQTGRISSPTLPSRYPKRINCVYVIDSGHIDSVVLSLDRLNIGSSSAYNHDGPCYKDWLTISCLVNGTSKAHPNADRKLCGSQSPFIARFPACRSVVLNFSSEYALDSTGFTIRYRMGDNELDCGTTLFSNSSGGISVPNNPTNFPATVNCTYTISTNRTSDIWLNIPYYSLREFLKSFQDCDRDNLTIVCIPEEETDLNRVRTRVLCSRDAVSISYSDSRLVFVDCFTLKLSIRSGIYDHRQMLQFPFSVFAGDEICGNTSFSAQTGRISSPTLPSRYPKRINCVYVIDSGYINSVVLSIDRLNIGSPSVYTNNGPCYKDWLTITCLVNGTSMDRPDRNLCGSQNPFIARFPACRSVLLNFSSDYAIDYTGFTIRYRMGDYELDCGPTQLSNSSGVISLPNNPTNFPATVNCTYTISKNRTSDIWLDIHYYWLREFLKSFQDCDRNNVTIVCIPEEETDLNRLRTRVFCSRDISSISYSDNRLVFVDCFKLKLYIRSDIYDYRQISRVPVSVFAGDEICGNTSYSAQTGVISSPTLSSRYPKRINCVYVIDSGHINSVVLRIERLNIGSSSVYNVNEPCYNDWLTITCLVNGTSMDHPNADRKLCGSQSPFIARFPACRSVLLNFSSDYALGYTGFTIRYRIGDYDPECGNTSFSGPSGVITSPQFPLSYAHNLNCLYSITGGQQNSIFLSVILLSLEGTSNTLSLDNCPHDWLTVSCLSDDAVVSMANLSSSRRYCGVKTAPLTFEFPSCAAVVLNFRSDSSVTGGGFLVRYTVKNADLICGSPIYGRPSGVINVPWNYTDYDGSLDCNYVINATAPSSISLTIWSISLQSLFGGSCQRDWLLVTCIDGQRTMNLNVTHTSCDNISSSIQLTFPDCTATQLGFHRDVDTVGRTFRIEYAVVGYGGNVNATEFLTTSIAAAQPLGTAKSCATGCKLSSDSTNCDCLPNTSQTPTVSVSRDNPITRRTNCAVGCKLNADGNTCDCSTTHSGDNAPSTKLPTTSISAAQPAGTQTSCPTGCKLSSDSKNCDCPPDTSQTAAISVSKEIPITRSANCEVGCEMNTDRTTCDCPTTHSGDLVVITQMNFSSQRGHAVGISLAVILVITGAICLGAFLLFRRHQKKNRSEALLQASEEDRAQMELEADSTKSGSLFGIQRRQDRDTSRYLPLRPVSTIDHEEPSTGSNTTEIHDEIKPGL